MATLLLATLSGCAITPETIIQQPMTARPEARQTTSIASNGAIYQAAAYRPLFEDRRARLMGDILTITINEKTSAGKAATSSSSKSGATSFSGSVVGLPLKFLNGDTLSTKTDNKSADGGAVNSSNTFVSTIAVTVIEVLPNGNMVVAGEKQVAFDKGAEFVRFSGVVSPDTIAAGNIVSSLQVADARIEYRTNSRIDKADVASWFSRFFLSVLPL